MKHFDLNTFVDTMEEEMSAILLDDVLFETSSRNAVLAELDARMASGDADEAEYSNCPEHLYSIDDDKMALARGLDG